MRAISVMPIGAVVGPMPHRGAACRTPLCPLGHHAPRRLRDVRKEIGTKSHRIGRAGLTGLGCTLSGSASHPHCADSNQQKCGRQGMAADAMCDTQHVVAPPGSARSTIADTAHGLRVDQIARLNAAGTKLRMVHADYSRPMILSMRRSGTSQMMVTSTYNAIESHGLTNARAMPAA
jgi:hypothetical protein